MADLRLTVPLDDLKWALNLLTEVHTKDDDRTGFVVEMGALPPTWISSGDYVKAWTIIRMQLGRNVNPSPTPA